MPKPFDVKERERLRIGFLKVIYEKELRERTEAGTIIDMTVPEIAKILGVSESQSDRISSDLESQGRIQSAGGDHVALTEYGREYVEDYLHELYRGWFEKMKDRLASPAIVGGIAGFITSLVVNVLSASDMPWWLNFW
jgi:CTP-dependent riboflavin kinase